MVRSIGVMMLWIVYAKKTTTGSVRPTASVRVSDGIEHLVQNKWGERDVMLGCNNGARNKQGDRTDQPSIPGRTHRGVAQRPNRSHRMSRTGSGIPNSHKIAQPTFPHCAWSEESVSV